MSKVPDPSDPPSPTKNAYGLKPGSKPKTFKAEQQERLKEIVKSTETINQKGDLHAARPKGIVPVVKELTNNGRSILEMWANIALHGEHEGKAFGNRERLEASKLLFERGFGKSVEAHVHVDARNVGPDGEVDLSSEQLTRLLFALAPPPGTPTTILEGNVRRGDAEFGGEMPDVQPDAKGVKGPVGMPIADEAPEVEEAILVPHADTDEV